MLNRIARTLAVGVTLIALVTPAALAASPTGTDPEPRLMSTILTLLGLG
jgi:hypothetical protein